MKTALIIFLIIIFIYVIIKKWGIKKYTQLTCDHDWRKKGTSGDSRCPKCKKIKSGYGSMDYYSVLVEANKESDRMMQEFEDNKTKSFIEMEARRWFNEKLKDKNAIIIFSPQMSCYTIYDEDSAKYINSDIKKLVQEEYKKLCIA